MVKHIRLALTSAVCSGLASATCPGMQVAAALTQASVPAQLLPSVLDRPVTVSMRDVTIEQAIDKVGDAAHVAITINTTEESFLRSRVSLDVHDISLKRAIAQLLAGTHYHLEMPAGGGPVVVHDTDTGNPERAQQPSVHSSIVGTVRDAETGERLVSVEVRIAETDLHALTGGDGRYTLKGVPPGQHAVATRRLGYAPTTRIVDVPDSQATLVVDLRLPKSKLVLEQVVTTATGNELALQVGNTMASIQADSVVAKTGVADLSSVLTARVPGVQVYNSEGLVGVSPQVNIRGQNSAQLSNQPLLYIDGVRVGNSVGDDYAGASGRLNDILPEEIESIEVIKGPAASALYGTDAANGIIVVHTKHGSVGKRQWAVHAETGSSSVDKSVFPDNYTTWGRALDGTNSAVVCPLTAVAEHTCAQDSTQHYSPLKDNYTTPLGTGGVNEIGGQVSGGNDTRYFLSGAYAEQGGYLQLPQSDLPVLKNELGSAGIDPEDMHPNNLTKESFRANLSTGLGATADVGVGAAYVGQNDEIPSASGDVSYAFGGPAFRDTSGGWEYGARPLYQFVQHQREALGHFTINATPTWHPSRWLSLQATAGVDNSDNYTDQLTAEGADPFIPSGFRNSTHDNTTVYTTTANAVASVSPLEWLTSSTAIGVNYNRTIDHQTSAQQSSLGPGCQTVNCGSAPFEGELNADQVTAGVYAEQTVGFHDRLFLKGGARIDGGSSFGSSYQSTLYPRASASWLVIRDRTGPIPGLTLFRLRAAYGQAGVQPGPSIRYTVETSRPVFVDSTTTLGSFLSQVANTGIRPERQTEYEGGADAEWFGGRLHVEGTYYRKWSSDALVSEPLPTSLGGFPEEINVGQVDNEGWEALLSARVLDFRAISWTMTFNGSVNHNKLVKFASGLTCAGAQTNPQICAGYPLFSYFDYPVTFADRNHDGIIDTNEVTIGKTSQFQGPSYPKSQLTMEQSVSLFNGQLQVNALVDYRGQFLAREWELADQVSTARALYIPGSPLNEQAAALAAQQGYYAAYLVDGSFARLRNVAVTYSLPGVVNRMMHVRTASVTVSGMNLFVWTKFKGGDVEEAGAVGSAPNGAYQPASGLVPARTFVVRLNLGL